MNAVNPHHPRWGDNRLAERATLREMPRDDARLAKWKEAENRIETYISYLIVVGLPLIVWQLIERI